MGIGPVLVLGAFTPAFLLGRCGACGVTSVRLLHCGMRSAAPDLGKRPVKEGCPRPNPSLKCPCGSLMLECYRCVTWGLPLAGADCVAVHSAEGEFGAQCPVDLPASTGEPPNATTRRPNTTLCATPTQPHAQLYAPVYMPLNTCVCAPLHVAPHALIRPSVLSMGICL